MNIEIVIVNINYFYSTFDLFVQPPYFQHKKVVPCPGKARALPGRCLKSLAIDFAVKPSIASGIAFKSNNRMISRGSKPQTWT